MTKASHDRQENRRARRQRRAKERDLAAAERTPAQRGAHSARCWAEYRARTGRVAGRA